MANCREIPFIPYYGSIDATPLFLITLEHYIRWSDDWRFLQRHWPNAEAAASWMPAVWRPDDDGFLEYSKSPTKASPIRAGKIPGTAVIPRRWAPGRGTYRAL